jgi:hypothetical protein
MATTHRIADQLLRLRLSGDAAGRVCCGYRRTLGANKEAVAVAVKVIGEPLAPLTEAVALWAPPAGLVSLRPDDLGDAELVEVDARSSPSRRTS